MMMLTGAKRKLLAFTDDEFFKIMESKGNGFLDGFELIYVELPEELKVITSKVNKAVSNKMV